MIEVVEREGGHGHSNTDWSKAGELAARWRRLLEANREQIRAGRLFKIGEPPLTPGLFPRGFHFQRKDKPPWPDWSGNAAESEIVPDEPAAGGEKAAARGPAVEGAPPDPTAKLVQAFEKAKYGWQQLEIAQQMVKSGDRSLIPALSRHLDSDDEHLRCNAGFVLAGLGDERGLEAIISELKTKKLRPLERPRSDTGEPFLEQRYGYYAIHVLGKLRDKRAVPVLIEFLDKEQEHRDIEWALGEIGDQRATAALKRVLKHEDPHRHLWAGSALAKLGDPAGVPTVAKFLKDSQWTYRRHAAEGLGASGDARAVPHLIEALSDESPDVRVSACQALAEFGDPKALPHLEKLLDDRTTTKTRGPTVVRDEARKAVESIQSKQPRWGPAVEGVQVRLRADKRVWKAGDTPTFKADIRNGAKSTLYDTRGRRTIYNLEFDGQWYIDPSRVRKRPLAIRAGGEHAGGGVLPLSPKNWRRTEPPRTLELTPGKHTMRVALVGTLGAVTEAGGGKPVRAVSNPVEIEIVADKPAPDAEKAAAPSVEVYRKHVANLVLPQRDDPYVPSQKWLKERLAAAVPYLFETRVKYKDQFSRVPVVADLLFKAWEQGLLSDRQKRSLLENTLLVGWDLREAYPPGYAREGGVSFRGVIVQTDVLSDPFGPEGPLKASYRVVLEDKQQVGEHAKGTVIQQGETRGSDSKYLWFPAHLQPGDYPLKVRLEVTKRAGQWRHSWWRPGQLRIDPELKPESIVAPGSENLPQEKAVRFVEGLAKQYAWDSGEQKFLVTAPAVKIEPRAGFDMDIVARLPIEVEIDGKIFGKPHFYGGFSCIDGHSPPGRQYTFQPSPDVPLRPGKFRWRIVLVPDLRWAWTEPGVDRLCNRKLTSPWYTAEITIADLDAFRQQQTLGERATDFDTKLRHFRNALTWQSDHPEKVALEYRVAVMLKEFYDSRTSTWPRRKEALAMFRGIVDRYDHMAYYTNMGAGGRWEAQVAVPNAAVRAASLLSVLGSDKEEVARYRSRALEMMNQTCRRRIREWSTAPRPQEPDAMLGGLGERSKHQFRVAEWERRKKAAAIGKVLSASELETVKGIVPSIDRSRGGRATPQVLARLRQIAESYRGTAIARIAQQRLEAAKGDPGVLLRQLNAGELSDEKIRQITDKVLDLQADLDQKWDGAWGNWLETARVMGKVSDADFTRYAKQSNPTWKLLALQITREDGKLGLSFGISHFGGRVASSTTDHNLIIKHRLVRLRLGDVPLDVGNTGGEWSFAATTQHGFGLFREKSEIEGLEKLEPGKYEAVAEIEVTIYEAGKPDTTLHLLRTQVKDELKLTPLLLGSAARPGASEPTAEDANDEAWGKAVAGVQCRLEADKPTWGAAEMLTLKAYVRHQTETILFLSNHPSFGARLEVDGHWHRWSGPMGQWQGQSHGSSKFRTKDEQPLKITLDVNWKQVDNKQPLGLDPGRHVVRFAWEGFAEKGPRQGPDQQREVVLLSNPVEITIRPDSPQPKLADVHPDDKDAAVALQRLGAILAAGDQGRIRSVRLSRTAVTDADLGHFKGLSGLRSLHLDDTRISDAGLRHIAGLAGLKTLSVNYTQVGDAGLEHLKGLGQLSLLELLETEVTAAGLRELKKALPGLQATVDPLKLSGLAELRGWRNSAGLNDDYGLVSVDLLGPKVADAWLERLKDRHTLQDVCLDRRNITDAGLAHLQGLANLHTLYLSGTQVTDRGLEYLKGMKKLRTLFLAETPIGDAGLAHLSGLTDLELLWINGTRVTDAGLVHLKPLTKLTRLKLNDCQVSGAGLSHLRGLTKLTTLELNGTAVADAGLVHVRPFVNLELLYLSHTSVTDAGLGHLSGLTKLRALMIEHAHVTDQGIKMLKLALPKTSFYH